MVSVSIGTAGAISAYFFGQAFSSLNGSDSIKGQLLPLLSYECVFGYGLIFWLLVLLWPNLRYSDGVVFLHITNKDARQKDIREVAKLITVITTINLCGCLVLPVRKLPLLVRFLVLFQLSSNLALLLIWRVDSRRRKEGQPKYQLLSCQFLEKIRFRVLDSLSRTLLLCLTIFIKFICLSHPLQRLRYKRISDVRGSGKGSTSKGERRLTANLYTDRRDDYSGEAGASGSEHAKDDRVSSSPLGPTMTDESICEAASGETRPTATLYADGGDGYGRKDGVSESEHGGDGDGGASGSEHGSEAGGREESGHDGRGLFRISDGGDGDGGASGSEHGSEAGGSEESGGGGREESEGRYGGDDGGGGEGEGQRDPEHGVRKMNRKPTLKISKISEMSIMVTAQTTATLISFHLSTSSSSTKVLLGFVLVVQLVAYLCGLTSMLIELQNPRAARVFARIGFACTALGYILMVAMFVHWYIVLITVLLFGVIWIIFFQSDWYPVIIKARSWLVNNRLLRR